MNAQDIWSGNEYAYYAYKGRNEPFRFDAKRIRVLRVVKKREYGNSKASTYVECYFLNREDGEPIDSGVVRTVRARDVAMLWENYEQELAYRQREKERIETERQEAEQASELAKERIRLGLEKKGIDRLWVYNITDQGVHLSRSRVEQWIKEDNG